VAFGSEFNSIMAITLDGMYYSANFDPGRGGNCILDQSKHFMNIGTDD